MAYQIVVIEGNLGRDPEQRFLASGDGVTNFSVAVTEKGSKGKEDTTTWFRCVAFGKVGEIAAQYLKKGSNVLVDGRIRTNKYTDKSGVERDTWEVLVNNLRMIGKRPDGDSKPVKEDSIANIEDDIPFN